MRLLISTLFVLFMAPSSFAHLPPKSDQPNPPANTNQATYRMDCSSGQAQTELAINNVRARLTTGGDMWWNRSDAGYAVPVIPGSPGDEVNAIFAGAVWIGGLDPGSNLKTACQTYGSSSGNEDFWPGPLSDDGQTDADNCMNWDKFFAVTREDVDLLRANWAQAVSEGRTELEDNEIPDAVKGWPGQGNPFFASVHGFELPSSGNGFNGLADFWDEGGIPGIYEPQFGDFPILAIRNCNTQQIIPDQMIFSIINDGGGIHVQSNGDAILMEIHSTAFGFKTANELNDMTFYKYRLVNRAIEDIQESYFGLWVDPDLGCYTDDFIGCDSTRNLAYVYNADDLDGETSCTDCGVAGINTYCTDIPVLGVDILRGPLDEFGVELGMSSFTYYDSPAYNPIQGMNDPQEAVEFYNFLTGRWRDGTPLSQGGTGYNPASPNIANFAFPTPPNETMGWSMCDENLGLGDRRFIQSMGPFTLKPGAINELITSVIYVPSIEYPCPDLSRFFAADDKAQSVFDDCFEDATSIKPIPSELDQINLFPNPYSLSNGTGQLTISNLPAESSVRIFNIQGQLLGQYQGNDQLVIDIADDFGQALSNGTYVVQVNAQDKGQKAFKLIVVQ